MLFSIPNAGDTSYIKNLIESMNRTPNLLKEDSIKAVNQTNKDYLSLGSDKIDEQLRTLISMKNAKHVRTAGRKKSVFVGGLLESFIHI